MRTTIRETQDDDESLGLEPLSEGLCVELDPGGHRPSREEAPLGHDMSSVPQPPKYVMSPVLPMTPARAESVVGVVLDEHEGETASTLAQLLERPGYQRHLRLCGRSQEIMLGHADTTLRESVKAELRAVAARFDVAVQFRAGILEGAEGHRVIALVDTARAFQAPSPTPIKRKVFGDANTPTREIADELSKAAATPDTERPDAESFAGSLAAETPVGRTKETTGCWCRS